MDVTVRALRVANKTLELLPVSVPGLLPAVVVALKIAELAQGAKDAKDGCHALALRAAGFCLKIHDEVQAHSRGVDFNSTSVARHIADLTCTLEDIESLMKRRKKAHIFRRLLHEKEMQQEVKDIGTRLEDAIRLFSINSAIATQSGLAQLAAGQGRLVQHADDADRASEALLSQTRNISQHVVNLAELVQKVTISTAILTDEDGMMLLRSADIDYVRELDGSEDEDEDYEDEDEDEDEDGDEDEAAGVDQEEEDQEDVRQVVRYEARIRQTGENVILKRYTCRDEAFKAAIRRSKKTFHPGFARIFGYSRPECRETFIVMGMDLKPIDRELENLYGVDRFLRSIQLCKELMSVSDYMRRKGLFRPWETRLPPVLPSKQLYFTRDGCVRWDIDVWEYDVAPTTVATEEHAYELHGIMRILALDTLKRTLNSPMPITRAASLLRLWDRISESVSLFRHEHTAYSPVEQLSWVGTSLDPRVGDLATVRGEDYVPSPETLDLERLGPLTHICLFDEDALDEEWHMIPDCEEVILTLELNCGQSFPDPDKDVRLEYDQLTRDEKWKRHTVHNMDYGMRVHSAQIVREKDSCRSFFLTQAVSLDIKDFVYGTTEPDESLYVVRALAFTTTSYVVPLTRPPFSKPPSKLYFYSLIQDENSIHDFSVPWGYWSTDPEPVCEWPALDAPEPERRAFIRKTGIESVYCGYSHEFRYVWSQCAAGFLFRTEVMVAIQMVKPTEDELLLLRDFHKCLEEAYKANRLVSREDIGRSVRRKRVELDDEEEGAEGGRYSWGRIRIE
ncbi:hypothetical protein BD413DRAFT_611663 [Trametes elegans]|nr:hypothetical protein BD413DRAFT_611663 [Trametes elegans]